MSNGALNSTAESTSTFKYIDVAILQEYIDYLISRVNFCTMLFGIFGNLVCILVLFQKNLLSRKFNWYFLALSFADFTFCTILFTNYLVYALSSTSPPHLLYDLSKITCYLTDYVVNSTDAFSVFLTLILSIDRLYAITNPIKVRMFITYRFPKFLILTTYSLLLVIKLPEIFLSQREFKLQNSTNENLTMKTGSVDKYICSSPQDQGSIFVDAKNNNKLFIHIIYSNILLPLLLNILPAIVILILNMTLWFFIRHYTNQISSNKLLNVANQTLYLKSKTHRITKAQRSHYFTIIILGIWLLFTSIPYYSLCTYYWFDGIQLKGDHSPVFLTLQAISSAFFNLNHCINVIIYIIFHKDFRANALSLFVKCFNLNPVVKINPMVVRGSNETKSNRRNARVKKTSTSNHSSSGTICAANGYNNANNNNTFRSRRSNEEKSHMMNGGGNGSKKLSRNNSAEIDKKCESSMKMKKANRLAVRKELSDVNKLKSSSMFAVNLNGSKQSVAMNQNEGRIFIPNEQFILFRYLNKKKKQRIEMAENKENKEKLLRKDFEG